MPDAGDLEDTVRNLHEQVEGLLRLAEQARRIQTAASWDEIASAFLHALEGVVPGAPRALYLRTEDGIDFACRAAEGCAVGHGDLIAIPLEVVDWVCEHLRPTTHADPAGEAVAIAPLVAGGEVAGLLELRLQGGQEAQPQRLLDEVMALCGHAAAALQNASLRERLVADRQELARTGALLRDILESVNHGILTLDPAGRVAMMNRNAGSMLGVDAADVAGRGYREVFGPEAVRVFDGVVEEARAQGWAMDKPLVRRNDQGIELTLGVSGSVLADAGGRPAGVIVICRDMTASKELERLRALDSMKSQFVSNVSHELRTPLTSIKAYTDALTGMVEGEMQQKFLKVIDEESDRLLGMIEDLLNVSRIESGKFRLQWEAVDVREVVQSILAISKVQSDRHRIVVDVEASVPPSVPMDKNKIKEVLINLVNNAIKYSPEGGEVRLSARREEGNLRFDVSDHGLGLSPENQKKLFQMFFRTEQVQAMQIRGTGLGLAITKGIVEAHGGVIRVHSEGEGKGSTFSAVLPIRPPIPGGPKG